MFPEERDGEKSRSTENRQKGECSSAGIDRLLVSFDRKTYNSGKYFL